MTEIDSLSVGAVATAVVSSSGDAGTFVCVSLFRGRLWLATLL